jgi:hypothetical protein
MATPTASRSFFQSSPRGAIKNRPMQLQSIVEPKAASVACFADGARTRARFAGVAQLVEHRFCKPKVRGSSPLASSAAGSDSAGSGRASSDRASSDRVQVSEGCPSGQREQAVNLPASAYEGSNPSPSTAVFSDSVVSDNVVSNSVVSRGVVSHCAPHSLAGVAQLVERQPSKLNVAGSNPVSRSVVNHHNSSSADSRWQSSAHIAQVVERVLGKDEVTSSNLVVGSRGLFSSAPVASRS